MLTKRLLYQAIGFVYLIAFLSLYPQFLGLVGHNGILPYNQKFEIVYQNLQNTGLYSDIEKVIKSGNLLMLSSLLGLTVDCACDVLFWLGLISSSLIGCGYVNSLFFFLSWISYVSLVHAGQTFLSFQWDILLCECGFLCVISTCFFPITSSIPLWNFRFLAWKLMFLSGAVKLLSRCPTWENLTALEYHFATQCIPTPLSWYAYQLPNIILRLAVAMTIIIEIPLTFLLVMPCTYMRRIGVVFQVILQVIIQLTGNYNFFNILTSILMISCWYDDSDDHNDEYININDTSAIVVATTKAITQRIDGMSSTMIEDGPFLVITKTIRTLDKSAMGKYIQYLASISFILYSIASFLKINVNASGAWWMGEHIMLRMKWDAIEPVAIPASAMVMIITISLMIGTFAEEAKKLSTSASSTFLYVIHVLWLLLGIWIMITMVFLSASKLESIGDIKPIIPAFIYDIRPYADPFLVSSSYGLFRRMTGVGKDKHHPSYSDIMVPTVTRPEIVIELYDGMSWKPLDFYYKPTPLYRPPPFIAPHQPRLDWQMWFAALGPYQDHPWLISFIYKFINPSSHYIAPEIIALVDSTSYHSLRYQHHVAVKATLYDYEFTNYTSSNRSLWWSRSNPREYLPALDANNPSIIEFLKAYHIEPQPYQSSQQLYEECLATDVKLLSFTSLYHDPMKHVLAWIHNRACGLILYERNYENAWRSMYYQLAIGMIAGLIVIRRIGHST